ncbi:MAG: hypothetical protein ACFNS8_02515 [Kingella oralis]
MEVLNHRSRKTERQPENSRQQKSAFCFQQGKVRMIVFRLP